MLTLMLMRHAQSLGNLQGQMEGQRSSSLSPAGHWQARRLSQSLIQSDRLPTHLYSSPLRRATQTADSILDALRSAQHRLTIQPAEALQEVHQGIFQGLTWDQAQARYPQLCARLLSTLDWQPVPEAESLLAARMRAQQWLSHTLSSHHPGDVIWAVSHEGILQQLISVVMGCDRTWKISIPHTALFEFQLAAMPAKEPASLAASDWPQSLSHNRFNPEYWRICRFNDTSHCTSLPIESAQLK